MEAGFHDDFNINNVRPDQGLELDLHTRSLFLPRISTIDALIQQCSEKVFSFNVDTAFIASNTDWEEKLPAKSHNNVDVSRS